MGVINTLSVGNATPHLLASSTYAICNTPANNVTKEAYIYNPGTNTTTGFTLLHGVTIKVYFQNSNTAINPILKINGQPVQGVIIYKYNNIVPGVTPDTSWKAGSVISLTYDCPNSNSSPCWRMNDYTGTQTLITNTTGTTAYDSNNNLYIVGSPDRQQSAVTYTNNKVYINGDSLYSNNQQVVTVNGTQTLSNKSLQINGETRELAAAATHGIDSSISAGSTSSNVPTTAAVVNYIRNNTAVNQDSTYTSADYRVLLSHSENDNDQVNNTVYKNTNLQYNPGSTTLSVSAIDQSYPEGDMITHIQPGTIALQSGEQPEQENQNTLHGTGTYSWQSITLFKNVQEQIPSEEEPGGQEPSTPQTEIVQYTTTITANEANLAGNLIVNKQTNLGNTLYNKQEGLVTIGEKEDPSAIALAYGNGVSDPQLEGLSIGSNGEFNEPADGNWTGVNTEKIRISSYNSSKRSEDEIPNPNLFRNTAMKTSEPNQFVIASDTDFTRYFRWYNGARGDHGFLETQPQSGIYQDIIVLSKLADSETPANKGIAFGRWVTYTYYTQVEEGEEQEHIVNEDNEGLLHAVNFDINETYTLSCWAKTNIPNAQLYFGLTSYLTNGEWRYRDGQYAFPFFGTDTWQKFTFTFCPKTDTLADQQLGESDLSAICYCITTKDPFSSTLYQDLTTEDEDGNPIYPDLNQFTPVITLRNCKLQLGDKATSWIPNEEDPEYSAINSEPDPNFNAFNHSTNSSIITPFDITVTDGTVEHSANNFSSAVNYSQLTNGQLKFVRKTWTEIIQEQNQQEEESVSENSSYQQNVQQATINIDSINRWNSATDRPDTKDLLIREYTLYGTNKDFKVPLQTPGIYIVVISKQGTIYADKMYLITCGSLKGRIQEIQSIAVTNSSGNGEPDSSYTTNKSGGFSAWRLYPNNTNWDWSEYYTEEEGAPFGYFKFHSTTGATILQVVVIRISSVALF